MPKAEFGILDLFDTKADYTAYTPKKYHCVAIDDDLYLNDWWEALSQIDMLNVYGKGRLQPQRALSRWGITVIPPQSLAAFYNIVVTDSRYPRDQQLVILAALIQAAMDRGRYMIHYGI